MNKNKSIQTIADDNLFKAPKGYRWVEIDAKECKHRNIRVLQGNAKVKKLVRTKGFLRASGGGRYA